MPKAQANCYRYGSIDRPHRLNREGCVFLNIEFDLAFMVCDIHGSDHDLPHKQPCLVTFELNRGLKVPARLSRRLSFS
jgi:hypothetical protein